MLITSIRDYVQLKGRADLQEIARHFKMQESAIEPMIGFWVKKGIISRLSAESQSECQSSACSDCFSCNSAKPIYIWSSS